MKNRLYWIRTQKALSEKDVCALYQQHFGDKLPLRTLRKIEDDTYTPTTEVFMRLATLLDVTLDFMLCRTDIESEEVRIHQKGLVEEKVEIADTKK